MDISKKSLLTPAEAAKLLHVAPTTIRHWAQIGRLPFISTPGGHRRFDKKDILALMSPPKTDVKNEFSILIIEDDQAFADMLTQFLENLFPHAKIKIAYNPFDAGDLLHTFKPDVVMLDLMMAGMDGFSICHRIKSTLATSTIKVLAMTGAFTDSNVNKVMALGADTCFGKPLDFTLVEKTIKQLLEQKKAISQF
ncbi:response regulator [Colwellia psychrerythraea]|uniref:Response regulator receiver protein n=1 Tax=Colwellia psychrerythraea TaxID=28229 RepID=A0A099KV93_COLPS|nr:response regulator [Colwellia psychrerythraea]KGJ94634.1 response regulator receiver protein [Colwellia psychrerythraea]